MAIAAYSMQGLGLDRFPLLLWIGGDPVVFISRA
jgi:hypothetical protein